MIWIGIIVGFATGVVFITLLYTPLVDKVKLLEHKLLRDQELLDEALKTLRAYQKQNDLLRTDLDVMQRLVPPEVYQRYDDAPRTT